jgi:hypothetical protein
VHQPKLLVNLLNQTTGIIRTFKNLETNFQISQIQSNLKIFIDPKIRL